MRGDLTLDQLLRREQDDAVDHRRAVRQRADLSVQFRIAVEYVVDILLITDELGFVQGALQFGLDKRKHVLGELTFVCSRPCPGDFPLPERNELALEAGDAAQSGSTVAAGLAVINEVELVTACQFFTALQQIEVPSDLPVRSGPGQSAGCEFLTQGGNILLGFGDTGAGGADLVVNAGTAGSGFVEGVEFGCRNFAVAVQVSIGVGVVLSVGARHQSEEFDVARVEQAAAEALVDQATDRGSDGRVAAALGTDFTLEFIHADAHAGGDLIEQTFERDTAFDLGLFFDELSQKSIDRPDFLFDGLVVGQSAFDLGQTAGQLILEAGGRRNFACETVDFVSDTVETQDLGDDSRITVAVSHAFHQGRHIGGTDIGGHQEAFERRAFIQRTDHRDLAGKRRESATGNVAIDLSA